MTDGALAQLLNDATVLSPDHLTLAVGIDRVEMEAFDKLLTSSGDNFLNEVYSFAELSYSAGRVDRLAARFCAKEATLKALGTGIRGVALSDVEITRSPNGQPAVVLLRRAHDQATTLNIVSLAISMTHTKVAAEAVVVALLDTRKHDLNLQRRSING